MSHSAEQRDIAENNPQQNASLKPVSSDEGAYYIGYNPDDNHWSASNIYFKIFKTGGAEECSVLYRDKFKSLHVLNVFSMNYQGGDTYKAVQAEYSLMNNDIFSLDSIQISTGKTASMLVGQDKIYDNFIQNKEEAYQAARTVCNADLQRYIIIGLQLYGGVIYPQAFDNRNIDHALNGKTAQP